MDNNILLQTIDWNDMKRIFEHGQRIRHNINGNIWEGYYDSLTNKIICNITGITYKYKSITTFSRAHYIVNKYNMYPMSNGWIECECNICGEWVKAFIVRKIANNQLIKRIN